MATSTSSPRGVGLWLEGETFGCLRVLRESKERRNNYKVWICLCDKILGGCGKNVIKVTTSNLTSGNTQSCGCLQRERSRQAAKRRPRKIQTYTCACGRTITGVAYFRHARLCKQQLGINATLRDKAD